MKYLVLADVHSNQEALTAVLMHAKDQFGRILVCGDIVGYNANPKEVIDMLVNYKAICIRGNHDREVAKDGQVDNFNGGAASAVRWTRQLLGGTEYMDWLARLPQGPMELDEPGAFMCHGSPRHEDEYAYADAAKLLRDDQRIVFFGHTHIPTLSRIGKSYMAKPNTVTFELKDFQWMINPGSVGQPRDGDLRTAYALWDSDQNTVKFYRIPYDYKETQRKIREAGLPTWLADRLGPDVN